MALCHEFTHRSSHYHCNRERHGYLVALDIHLQLTEATMFTQILSVIAGVIFFASGVLALVLVKDGLVRRAKLSIAVGTVSAAALWLTKDLLVWLGW